MGKARESLTSFNTYVSSPILTKMKAGIEIDIQSRDSFSFKLDTIVNASKVTPSWFFCLIELICS